MEYTKKFFGIENYFTPVEGLDDGSDWNGWKCPIFTLDNIRLVCQRINAHGTFEQHLENKCDWPWYFVDEDGFPAFKQKLDGQPATIEQVGNCGVTINDELYYSIGNWEMCWEAWNTMEEFYEGYPMHTTRLTDESL